MKIKYLLFDFLNVIYTPKIQKEDKLSQTYRKQEQVQDAEGSENQVGEGLETNLNLELLQKIADWHESYPNALLTASSGLVGESSPFKQYLSSKFDHVFTTQDFGFPKSKPEIYVRVAKKLGVLPQEILFIDDLGPNIEAAKMAGMQTVQFVSNQESVPKIVKVLGA